MNTSNIGKTILFTALALVAFAANSVLCRLALRDSAIDPGNFTGIRLISGIVTLWVLFQFNQWQSKCSLARSVESDSESVSKSTFKGTFKSVSQTSKGSWQACLMLFIYAAGFSFAYMHLDTGIGALILFASVQLTMIIVNVVRGKALQLFEYIGVILAFAGFVYLVAPSLSTPSVSGFILMTFAGIAWGLYTLKGRGSVSPLSDTYYNFLRTLPFVLLLVIANIAFFSIKISNEGVLLAVLSGALASGIGYAIWYSALSGLTAMQAAVLQLLVPVIASVGGVVFANEAITLRLVIASLMILGGILIVIAGVRIMALWQPSRHAE